MIKGLSSFTGYDGLTGIAEVTADNSFIALYLYNGTSDTVDIREAWFNAVKLA